MRQPIIASFDIGSSLVRCVITTERDGEVCVLGVGTVPSEGVRRGVIVDVDDVARAVADAAEIAEEMSGEHITEAVVSVSGAGIKIEDVRGVVAVERPDAEVTQDDVLHVISSAHAIAAPSDKEIIHVLPRIYRLDNQENIKDPLGMRGIRLEVDAVAIHAPKVAVDNIARAMEQADIGAYEYAIEPLAAASSVLSKKQKELGVALVNLGASTTSIVIYEEGDVVHTAVLPVGSDFITHDLAIGLRTSLDVAEKIKRMYGSVSRDHIKRTDEIDLSTLDPQEEGAVLHDHVIEIIVARLEEIFAMVRAELVRVRKDQLLPAGVILTGGGSNLVGVVDFAKDALQLPVSIGVPRRFSGVIDHINDPSHATVIGLVSWQKEQGTESRVAQNAGSAALERVQSFFGGIGAWIQGLYRRLMP